MRKIKSFFAVILLGILIYVVDSNQLISAFENVNFDSILKLAFVSFALIYLSAYKWGLFLEAFGEKISVLRLSALYLLGYFVNLLLPSYVGGDLARSYYIGKKVGQHEAFSATVLERFTGLIAMVSLGFVLMWYSPLVTETIKTAISVLAVATATICFPTFWLQIFAVASKFKIVSKQSELIRKFVEAFGLATKDKKLFAKALLLSLLFHSATVVNTLVAARAVGWNSVGFLELYAVLPLALLIGALPITPSGLGIQEGAFLFFLQGVGATAPQALGVALILRAKTYVLACFGGIIWLNERRD